MLRMANPLLLYLHRGLFQAQCTARHCSWRVVAISSVHRTNLPAFELHELSATENVNEREGIVAHPCAVR
jgi:hypothetical protein